MLRDILPVAPLKYRFDARNRNAVSLGERGLRLNSSHRPNLANLIFVQFGRGCPAHVDGVRDDFQVIDVAARPHSAQMVEFEPIGNGAVDRFPRGKVRGLSVIMSVSCVIQRSLPHMARSLVSAIFSDPTRTFVSGASGAKKAAVRTFENQLPAIGADFGTIIERHWGASLQAFWWGRARSVTALPGFLLRQLYQKPRKSGGFDELRASELAKVTALAERNDLRWDSVLRAA